MDIFRPGTIAVCQHGKVGLITAKIGPVYAGIQLGIGMVGKPWESRKPKFCCHIDDLLEPYVTTKEKT